MKRKIISMMSTCTLVASLVSAAVLPWINYELIPCIIWMPTTLLAGIGALWAYETDQGPLFKRRRTRRKIRKVCNVDFKERKK
ncbi:MAG: hypothetical protein PHY47_20585 [Lachnospiraceae bacterium]|nr:hypothetical protein [Lachnospiraceae bacterium]